MGLGFRVWRSGFRVCIRGHGSQGFGRLSDFGLAGFLVILKICRKMETWPVVLIIVGRTAAIGQVTTNPENVWNCPAARTFPQTLWHLFKILARKYCYLAPTVSWWCTLQPPCQIQAVIRLRLGFRVLGC